MMNRRVVITGMGWITPLGLDIEGVWKRLLAGESGIAPTTIFDARTFPTQFAAEVKGFDLKRFLGPHYEPHKLCSRNAGFALAAAEMAWRDAGLNGAPTHNPEMVGVYLGGGEGPIDFDNFVAAAIAGWDPEKRELDSIRWAQVAAERLTAVKEFEQDPNCAAGHIACRFNAQGPNFNTLTACAASTQALGEAAFLIRRGDADVMISGGAHSMIHPLGVTGFNRLTALSTRNDTCITASRPFDRTRDGFVLGEGAGILILEEFESASRRGARILAELDWLGADVYLAHCVYANDEEIGLLARTRTGVSLCPTSNMRLGSGLSPIGRMLAAGVRAGLGLDGSSSNDGGNVLAEARQALLVARATTACENSGAPLLPVVEAFKLATSGGATCLNRPELGHLNVGAAADFAMFRRDDVALAGAAAQDPLAALVLCDPPRAERVFVAGREVVRDGRIVALDETALGAEFNDLVAARFR